MSILVMRVCIYIYIHISSQVAMTSFTPFTADLTNASPANASAITISLITRVLVNKCSFLFYSTFFVDNEAERPFLFFKTASGSTCANALFISSISC